MQTITREVLVNAPPERVFSFLVDPHNLSDIWPGIVEVKSVKKIKNHDGFKFNWNYRMAEVDFEGRCETIEHVPNERIVIKSTKGLDSTITWTFKPSGQNTLVNLTFDYQIPAAVLKQAADEAVARENERQVETMLQNLKNRLELEPAHA